MDRSTREYVATKDDVSQTNGSVSEGDSLTFIPTHEDADSGSTTGVVFLPDGRTVVRTVQAESVSGSDAAATDAATGSVVAPEHAPNSAPAENPTTNGSENP